MPLCFLVFRIPIERFVLYAYVHCTIHVDVFLASLVSIQAHVLSSIANADWPDEYPDLLTSLIHLLSSGSTDSVHGAMQVFTEFIKADLTEDQLLPVLRDLLPSLLNILGARDVCYVSLQCKSTVTYLCI